MPIVDPFDQAPPAGGIIDPFDGAAPPQQRKREVGFLEGLNRKVREGGEGAYKLGGLALSTPARAVDSIAGVFGYNPGLEEAAFEHIVAPAQANIEKLRLQPNEEYTTVGGNLGAGVGALLDPQMAGAMAGGAVTLPSKVPQLATAAAPTVMNAIRAVAPKMAGPAMAATLPAAQHGYERTQSLMENGVDPTTANLAGLTQQAGTISGMVAPMSAGSAANSLIARVLSRGAQGAVASPVMGAASRAAENMVLAGEDPRLQQPVVSAETLIPETIMGAVFGQMGGRNRPLPTPDAMANMRRAHNLDTWGIDRADGYGPEIVPMEPAEAKPAVADPFTKPLAEATKEMNSRLFPDPGTAPDLSIVEPTKGSAKFETRANPDPAAIPSKLQLEGEGPNRVLADSDLRNIAKVLGLDEPTVLAMPRHAQEALRDHANQFSEATGAFDVAARRQRQADADMANRGELAQDYQASGAAASGGEFDSGVRRVTLLDKQQPIEVLGNDGKTADIRYQDRNGDWHRMQVESKRVSEHDIPQNQRLAQDFRERAVEPTDKNGDPVPGYLRDTLNDEGSPRVATDRITGDQRSGRTTPYNPNEISRGPVEGTVERPGEGGLPPPKGGPRREGQTYDNEPPMQPPVRRAPTDVAVQPAEKGADHGQGQKAEVLTLPEPVKETPAPEQSPRAEAHATKELQKGREAAEPEAAVRQQPKADEGPDPWLTHENKPQQEPDSKDILDPKKLGKKKVEIDGKKVVAAEKLEELDARRDSLRQLLDCLKG